MTQAVSRKSEPNLPLNGLRSLVADSYDFTDRVDLSKTFV